MIYSHHSRNLLWFKLWVINIVIDIVIIIIFVIIIYCNFDSLNTDNVC